MNEVSKTAFLRILRGSAELSDEIDSETRCELILISIKPIARQWHNLILWMVGSTHAFRTEWAR